MEYDFEYTLIFRGRDSDAGRISFYDVSQALAGFERTVSLTNHFLVFGEVITQSPSAKGSQLFLRPPEEGSWKTIVGGFFGTALAMGVASKDSALGYLSVSALDYVIQQTLGFPINFDETLGESIQNHGESANLPKGLTEGRFDSLIEKVEPSIRNCHRPIAFSETATNGQIEFKLPSLSGKLEAFFDINTYEHISKTIQREDIEDFYGAVSSYNVNTYKGRIYLRDEERTVPFELSEDARTARHRTDILGSIYENGSRTMLFNDMVTVRGFRNESVNGRLKSIYVTDVNPQNRLSQY